MNKTCNTCGWNEGKGDGPQAEGYCDFYDIDIQNWIGACRRWQSLVSLCDLVQTQRINLWRFEDYLDRFLHQNNEEFKINGCWTTYGYDHSISDWANLPKD